MAKKKNNLILPLGIGAVIAAVWYFSRDTAAAPGATTPGAIPQTVTTNSATAVTDGFQSTPGQQTVGPQDLVISNWMKTLPVQAEVTNALNQLPAMTVGEKNMLSNIIVNVWGKNMSPDSDQISFWNIWRVKYHIEDGTYS